MLKINPDAIPEPITNYVFWSHTSESKDVALIGTMKEFNIPAEAVLITDYAGKVNNIGSKYTIFIAKEFEPDVNKRIQEIESTLEFLKFFFNN